jgi:exopolysaccharide biosynthesis protein
MSSTSLRLRRVPAADTAPDSCSRYERMRVTLGDGARTTLHVATYERRAFEARVAVLERPAPLVRWCEEQGVRHAVVGGFFLRPRYAPLGVVQLDGRLHPSVDFDAPWGEIRACVQVADGAVRIARRDALDGAARGDVLQAGPLLVADGRSVCADGEDEEGFSAGARQFDSDITQGRFPRAALAISADHILTVACDGRARRDAGMTLSELAATLVKLGATDALNLDGGGSASLVCDGRLRNRPREEHGADLLDGRHIVTAIVLRPR